MMMIKTNRLSQVISSKIFIVFTSVRPSKEEEGEKEKVKEKNCKQMKMVMKMD